MTVVDASAVLEFLLARPLGEQVADRLQREPPEPLAAPHLIDAEVGQALRRFERRGEIHQARARETLQALSDLPVSRYPHGLLLGRAFDLRDNVTFYDALYLALAELLGATLLTADAALEGVPHCSAAVALLS